MYVISAFVHCKYAPYGEYYNTFLYDCLQAPAFSNYWYKFTVLFSKLHFGYLLKYVNQTLCDLW